MWPEENGSFPHVSGMTFSINTLGNANQRVYNVKIENTETQSYEALELDRKYTVASNNFILLEGGDGMDMFEGAKVISDTGMLDIEVLESYIVKNLGGVIPETYAKGTETYATANTRITFTEGYATHSPYTTDGDHAIWIGAIGLALAIITFTTVMIIRKRRM